MLFQHFGLTKEQIWNDLTIEQVELRVYQAEKLEAERTRAHGNAAAMAFAAILAKRAP